MTRCTTTSARSAYLLSGTAVAALHLAFLAGLWRQGPAATLHASALALLGAFFVLQWLNAFWFPCDPGCAWTTTTGRLHYALSVASFVAVGLGTLAYAWHARTWTRPGPVWVATVVFVVAALALLAADRTGVLRGLVERLNVVALAAWVVTVARATRPA